MRNALLLKSTMKNADRARQCLLDAEPISECPNCNTHLTTASETGKQRLLCNLNNEGGFQQNYDLLPVLKEEAYLRLHPEKRKCRAFLEFCGEGDIPAMLDCLSLEEESDQEMEDAEKGEAPSRGRGVLDCQLLQNP